MVSVRRSLSLMVILLPFFALVPVALAQGNNPVQVTLVDGQIKMVNSLPAGSTTFMVTNNGTGEHSFEIEGNGIEEELQAHLQPGQNGTLTVNLQPGTYEVYCPVDAHRAHGMTMQVTVTAAATTGAPAPTPKSATGTTQQPAQAQPGALPTTGGVLSPGSSILWLGLGLLVLMGGLGLASVHRIR